MLVQVINLVKSNDTLLQPLRLPLLAVLHQPAVAAVESGEAA